MPTSHSVATDTNMRSLLHYLCIYGRLFEGPEAQSLTGLRNSQFRLFIRKIHNKTIKSQKNLTLLDYDNEPVSFSFDCSNAACSRKRKN
jgi:hypothetical protein